MALKRMVSKDEYAKFPDPVKEQYKKSDSGDDFLLETDESDYKAKLEEFRSNNRDLHTKIEKLTQTVEKFKGVDPDKYSKAVQALEALDNQAEAELIKQGKLDEVINRRTKAMSDDFDSKTKAQKAALETVLSELGQYKNKLGSLQIEQVVLGEVEKAGKLRTGARQDAALRARTVWGLNEKGELIAKDDKGSPMYGTKGDPLTPAEWSSRLLKDAPYLFESAGGGGAQGGDAPRTIEGVRVVANDPISIGRNAADIASGKAVVSST